MENSNLSFVLFVVLFVYVCGGVLFFIYCFFFFFLMCSLNQLDELNEKMFVH